jgi:UDP-glucose 4-epimerase
MHIAVTGGAGFIGSHLTAALLAQGYAVSVVDDLSTGHADAIPPGASLYQCDLRSQALFPLWEQLRPDAVIHCAAQISVATSLATPLVDLQQNAAGTVNLLEACRAFGTKRIIYTSSAAVYGVPEHLPIREDHPLAPLSPYGLSKLTGEWYTRLLGEQYGMCWAILRYANVFGPRQAATGDGAVVPAFIAAMRQGRDPQIHGNGGQTRDFVHVTDVCRANIAVLEREASGIFNIGSGTRTSIMDLWQLTAELTGWRKPPQTVPPRPGDIAHSVLDCSCARQHLGWQATIDIATGLSDTIAHWEGRWPLWASRTQ